MLASGDATAVRLGVQLALLVTTLAFAWAVIYRALSPQLQNGVVHVGWLTVPNLVVDLAI